jgi:TP901 family phage tail tape measure protein
MVSNILGDFVVRINGDITGFIAALAGAKAGMAGMGAAVGAWNAIGVGMSAALTVPIMAVGAVALASAQEVVKGYSIITGQTGATGAELEKLKSQFRDVFSNVPQSATQVATVIATVQDRLRGMNIDVGTTSKSMLDLARVTSESATGLSDAVSKMFKQWPEAAKDVKGTMEALFDTFQATHVPVTQLATDVDKFGTVWREAGFNLRETIAIMAQLDAAGLNSTDIVRGMAYAWSNLQKGSVATKGALADAYTVISAKTKELGLDTSKSSDMMQAFFKGIEDGTIKDSTAVQLFGSRFGANITGAIHEGRISSDAFIKSMAGMPGSLESTATAALTFSQKLDILRHKLEVAFAPLGFSLINMLTGFIPVIESIIGSVAGLVGIFATLPQPLQNSLIILGLFLAAIGPIALITNQLAIGWGLVLGVLTPIAAALGIVTVETGAAAAAQALLSSGLTVAQANAALLALGYGEVDAAILVGSAETGVFNALWAANPIGIIVLAVAALAVGIYLLYTNWKPFRDLVDGVLNALKEAAGVLAKIISDIVGIAPKETKITVNEVKGTQVTTTTPEGPPKTTEYVGPKSQTPTVGETGTQLGPGQYLGSDGTVHNFSDITSPTPPPTSREQEKGPAAPDVGKWFNELGPWGQRLKERVAPQGELVTGQVQVSKEGEPLRTEERTSRKDPMAGSPIEGQLKALGNVDIGSGVDQIGKAFDDVKGRILGVPTAIQNGFAEAFHNITTTLNTWKNAIGKVWDDIVKGAQEAGGRIVGFFQPAINALKAAWNTISSAATTAWNAISGGAKWLGGVLGQIAHIIGQVFTIAWLLISNAAKNAWNALVGFIGPIVTAIGKKWDEIKNAVGKKWDEIREAVGKKWDEIVLAATTKFNEIKDAIGRKWDEVRDAVGAKWDEIKNAVGAKWDEIVTAATTKFNEIKNAIGKVWDGIRDGIGAIWDNIRDTIGRKWDEIRDGATTKGGEVKTAATKPIDDLKTALGKIWDDIWTKIQEVWKTITTFFSGLTISIPQGLKDLEGILDRIIAKLSQAKEAPPDTGNAGAKSAGTTSASDGPVPKALGGMVKAAGGYGVLQGPQMVLAGEAGDEAFVPLQSGRIPVQIIGRTKEAPAGPTYITNVTVDSEGIVRKVFQAIQQLEDYHHLSQSI